MAPAGWNGDRLRVVQLDGKRLLHWRIVWDRGSDAREFQEAFDPVARGRGLVRGHVLDWVWGESKRAERALLERLEASVVEFVSSPEDQGSAEPAHARLVGQRARLEDGLWHPPSAGVVLTAAADWTLSESNGMPMLFGQEQSGLTLNLGLSLAEVGPDGLSEEYVRGPLAEELMSLGLELSSVEVIELDGRRRLRATYGGVISGMDLRFRSVLFESGPQIAILTATCGAEQFEGMEPVLREALASVKFPQAGASGSD